LFPQGPRIRLHSVDPRCGGGRRPGRQITASVSLAAPAPANDDFPGGHPYAIFRRSIDAGNVVAAEIAALELRGLSLVDALDLTALSSRPAYARMTYRRS